MSNTVEQIKERLDIVDVVSGYIQLKKAGASYKARCPFHSERTPSFVVSPGRQSYHCFGCGEHGDIFTFVEKIEGVDFKGAMQLLADKAGVEIKYEHPQTKEEQDTKQMMYDCMSSASEHYHNNLLENKNVLEYLYSRGLSDEILAKFNVGFAKDDWHGVESMLKVAGYTQEIAEKIGLIIKGEKGYYDRFRSRIMFPVRDVVGRVVAFSGRIYGADNEKTAKYINSPETALYNKSKILYGFDMAKQSIRKRNFTILVEGQMDLLATHQAGYTNTVAISGTALTQEHCVMIGRLTKNIVLALDADQAGIKAAGRSANIALKHGFDVKVAELPTGKDPADVLQEKGGKETWIEIVKNAKHIVEFLLDIYERDSKDERKFKKLVEDNILPFIRSIKSKIDQEHFIKLVAARIGVSENAVLMSINSLQPDEDTRDITPNKVRTVDYKKRFDPLHILTSIIKWLAEDGNGNKGVDGDAIRARVVNLVGKSKFDEVFQNISEADLMYIENLCANTEDLQNITAERLEFLRQSTLRTTRLDLIKQLHKAEAKKDYNAVEELQQKIVQINLELESVIPN